MREANAIKAESRAIKLLARFPLDPGGEIEDLAFAMGIQVEPGDFRNIDAWLLRRTDGPSTIRVRTDIRERGRRRFSIAHELGHWELHSDGNQQFLCTGENMVDYGRLPEEIEANLFASHLLIPKDRIPNGLRRTDPGFQVISDLAREFDVTLTAAARRFLDLSEQPLVLILSRNDRIQWVVRNKRARGFFVERDISVPVHSLTEEVLREKTNPSSSEQIDPGIWFPGKSFHPEFELFEDVRYSGHYEMALTLLWAPT